MNEQEAREAMPDIFHKAMLDFWKQLVADENDGDVLARWSSKRYQPIFQAGVESLREQLAVAREASRYALATFRALDRYTFEDSDHGLLIAEACKKLEALTAIEVKL